MAIVNGYTTLQYVKELINPAGLTTSAVDDTVIERLIEGASRMIDALADRWFYASTETRLYDVPSGRALPLDGDLLAITTLTNGDGTVLTTTDYYLAPRNTSPKFEIVLKESSSYTWEGDANGNTEGVISVAGTWGWTTTTPHDIRQACEQMVITAYRARYGNEVTGSATITAAGVVVTPQDISPSSMAIITAYRRYSKWN